MIIDLQGKGLFMNDVMKAAVRIIFARPHNACPQGILVNVAVTICQVPIGLDETPLVPASKNLVDSFRLGPDAQTNAFVEFVHESIQVLFRRPQHQMIVIVHKHEIYNFNWMFLIRFLKRAHADIPYRSHVDGEPLFIVASGDDVIRKL